MADIYIDPLNGSDSTGDGSSGNPYASLQNALDNTTQGASGDTFNLADTAADVLTAALDPTTYLGGGSTSQTAPIRIVGWDQGGDGYGEISGNGSVAIWNNANFWIVFHKMKLHSSGSNTILTLGRNCVVDDCEVYDTDARGIDIDRSSVVSNCLVRDVGVYGIITNLSVRVLSCSVRDGPSRTVTAGIRLSGLASSALFCVVDLDGSGDGIFVAEAECQVLHCTCYNSSGSGNGIEVSGDGAVVLNNYVEGYATGVQQIGTHAIRVIGFNHFFNNTSSRDLNTTPLVDLGDTDLASSGLIDAANDDFKMMADLIDAGYPQSAPGGYW